jgi:hypothetical protein
MRMTIAYGPVMVNCRPRVTKLDACPGMISKVAKPDEYDILVVNKFVLGLCCAKHAQVSRTEYSTPKFIDVT